MGVGHADAPASAEEGAANLHWHVTRSVAQLLEVRLIGPPGVKLVDGHFPLVGPRDCEDPAGRQMYFYAVNWAVDLRDGVVTRDVRHKLAIVERKCHCSRSQELQGGKRLMMKMIDSIVLKDPASKSVVMILGNHRMHMMASAQKKGS
jgi:hypothetical protein